MRVLFPTEGGQGGGDNKPPLAYFTLTMKDDTGEFSHQLFPAGHFKEEKFKKMEEKMRNLKKKTSSRRKLATCVDSQGVKVVPIKTFHQQRRSTALPSKVGWLQLWLVGLPQKYIFPSYSAILQACHFTIKKSELWKT